MKVKIMVLVPLAGIILGSVASAIPICYDYQNKTTTVSLFGQFQGGNNCYLTNQWKKKERSLVRNFYTNGKHVVINDYDMDGCYAPVPPPTDSSTCIPPL